MTENILQILITPYFHHKKHGKNRRVMAHFFSENLDIFSLGIAHKKPSGQRWATQHLFTQSNEQFYTKRENRAFPTDNNSPTLT